jgi:hypothetical protein
MLFKIEKCSRYPPHFPRSHETVSLIKNFSALLRIIAYVSRTILYTYCIQYSALGGKRVLDKYPLANFKNVYSIRNEKMYLTFWNTVYYTSIFGLHNYTLLMTF